MIQIEFNPKEMKVAINGHANYAESGMDIVCSAVSILFYTLAECITESQEMLTEEAEIEIDNGNGCISCKPKEEYVGNIERTYWTVLTGMQMLADNYPENVKFDVVG